MGVAAHACARGLFALAAPASAAPSHTRCPTALLFAAVDTRANAPPLHLARNSLVCYSQGPTGRSITK